ncbi:hypothetical protein P171DRAFT_37200 [Karstenula rhodostoma CBS 690.94]|uniref:Uncharacterized protein n=1 Tax=Karstenula rhodostoma CBS 690.94 TaxID=1392251 RepID=A0A9P4UAM6_9PLEO|nr:hypothetical protein P171DRAFT_37200 [Karstenula rhodostoma CBS 690.94]
MVALCAYCPVPFVAAAHRSRLRLRRGYNGPSLLHVSPDASTSTYQSVRCHRRRLQASQRENSNSLSGAMVPKRVAGRRHELVKIRAHDLMQAPGGLRQTSAKLQSAHPSRSFKRNNAPKRRSVLPYGPTIRPTKSERISPMEPHPGAVLAAQKTVFQAHWSRQRNAPQTADEVQVDADADACTDARTRRPRNVLPSHSPAPLSLSNSPAAHVTHCHVAATAEHRSHARLN